MVNLVKVKKVGTLEFGGIPFVSTKVKLQLSKLSVS